MKANQITVKLAICCDMEKLQEQIQEPIQITNL